MTRRARVLALLWLAFGLATVGPQPPPAGPVAAGPAREPVQPSTDSERLVDAVAARLMQESPYLVDGEIEGLARTLVRESRRVGLAPSLVLAVIEVESGFDPFAVSPAGAMGLMQVKPATGRSLADELGIDWQGERTLFDPVANLRIGVAYLAKMRDRFRHLPTALAAYNRGPGAIGRRMSRGAPIPEGYAGRVLSAYAEARLLPINSS